MPDAVHGESVVAFVVMKAGEQLSESEALRFMAATVSKFKVPQRVYFRDTLPKVGVGKILRRELRAEAISEMQNTV